jgi:hypothetical protein
MLFNGNFAHSGRRKRNTAIRCDQAGEFGGAAVFERKNAAALKVR